MPQRVGPGLTWSLCDQTQTSTPQPSHPSPFPHPGLHPSGPPTVHPDTPAPYPPHLPARALALSGPQPRPWWEAVRTEAWCPEPPAQGG